MAIAIQCSACGRKFRAPDEAAGKRVKCPNCAGLIQVGKIVRPLTASSTPVGKAMEPSAASRPRTVTAPDEATDDSHSFLTQPPPGKKTAPSESLVTCPQCQRPVMPQNYGRCPICQTQIKEAENAGSACPKCGFAHKWDGRHCGQCGWPFRPESEIRAQSAAEAKNAIRAAAMSWQVTQLRTRQDTRQHAGSWALGSVVAFLAGVGMGAAGYFWPLGGLVFGLGALLGLAIGLVGGLIQLVSVGCLVYAAVIFGRSLKSTRVVTCPRCKVSHHIYQSVTKYICTACGELLLLGRDEHVQPETRTCVYCAYRIAVCTDHGSFACSNCGLVQDVRSAKSVSHGCNCPKCGNPIPAEVLYCCRCGKIVNYGFLNPAEALGKLANDPDWEAGKDAEGWFHYSRALLIAVREGAHHCASICEVPTLTRLLTKALLAVVGALQETARFDEVKGLLRAADTVYTVLLECQLRALESLQNRALTEPERAALYYLAREVHITARKQLEQVLSNSVAALGSIGLWGERLLTLPEEAVSLNVSPTIYSALAAESTRFSRWLAEASAPADTK